MQEGLTLPNTTGTTKVNATFTFRNQNDLDIFRKLLEVQEMSGDDFATAAIHHYIMDLLNHPDKLHNPAAQKLDGLSFGDIKDGDDALPEPGTECIEIRKSCSGGSTYTSRYFYVGAFEGKSAQVLEDNEDKQTGFNWGARMYKGKKVYAFWLDVD